MSQLSQSEADEVARFFVAECLHVGKRSDGSGESVVIRYNTTDQSCIDFSLKVEEECWNRGAHTLLRPISYARERLKLSRIPDGTLKELEPLLVQIAETQDVDIYIGEYDDPNFTAGVVDKWKLGAYCRQKYREILDERKVRWAYLGWPIPSAAAGYGMDVQEFRRIFFNSIRQSFSKDLMKSIKYYGDALEGKDEVRILADDGTDLSFMIRGRPVLLDDPTISAEDVARGDVGLNIPCGEVFVAPLETTANGIILFEKAAVPGFGKMMNLRLKFADGRVANVDADEGAEYTGGSIIVDEKIYGTIHIAIGNNTGAYHGVNKASSHLDMIKSMKHGELYVDDKLVMKHGAPAT